jgi:hypothetical protein
MEQIANASLLTEKWAPVLNHSEASEIKDNYRRNVTAVLLENQEQALRESADAHVNAFGTSSSSAGAGGIDTFDPVLISLVRRAMPNLIAYDVASVQPMSGPTGLIFSLRARYKNQTGNEALFNEPDTDWSGEVPNAADDAAGTDVVTGSGGSGGLTGDTSAEETADNANWDPDHEGRIHGGGYGTAAQGDPLHGNYNAGRGMSTDQSEHLGTDAGPAFNEMSFTIDKATVTARSRALKAEYTTELAQDLKAVHGLDAESELANILSAEILGEINREVIRTIYLTAIRGCQHSDLTLAGNYNIASDSDGRWAVERWKGLLYQIEREANQIALETRRGKGNLLICNSNVASALAMTGMLDTGLATSGGSTVNRPDDTGDLFIGTLNGGMKCYVDPFATANYACIGYKGSNPYDAGMYYCPYVPLQMVRAVDEQSFQPKIGFKTRYGLAQNPFNIAADVQVPDVDLGGRDTFTRENLYYRIFSITGLHGGSAGTHG